SLSTDAAPTSIYTLSLHDALPICELLTKAHGEIDSFRFDGASASAAEVLDECRTFGLMRQQKLVIVDNADALLKSPEDVEGAAPDRKSTRLNSSHVAISYAVFCLK